MLLIGREKPSRGEMQFVAVATGSQIYYLSSFSLSVVKYTTHSARFLVLLLFLFCGWGFFYLFQSKPCLQVYSPGRCSITVDLHCNCSVLAFVQRLPLKHKTPFPEGASPRGGGQPWLSVKGKVEETSGILGGHSKSFHCFRETWF